MAPIVSALAREYGKRPQYLAYSVLLLAGSILCARSGFYHILLAGRLVQGLGTAAFESLPFLAIGDMYHVHQRGMRMALYTCSAVELVLFPSRVAGVAVKLSWRWCFVLLSIFIGGAVLGVILLAWETTFIRGDEQATNIQVRQVSLSQ